MKLVDNERGSVVVIVALGMVVFLSLVAFVTDIGLFYLKRSQLQNALDAAVLAAAQELPSNPQSATQVARQYAADNGFDPNTLNIQISNDNKKISLASNQELQFHFAKIMGINQADVAAQSSAKVAPVTQVSGIVPFSVEQQDFTFGSHYSLKLADPDHGWCGPLALGGDGASTYEENLTNGYNQPVKIGDVLETKTGNMSGPTKDGIAARFTRENHPPCTAENYLRDCPRLVNIPVVQTNQVSGQVKSVTVVGFAAFLIDNVPGNGNNSIVSGTFIQTVSNAETSDSQPSFGLNGVKLTKN